MPFRITIDEDVPPEGVTVTRFDQPANAGGLFDGRVTATARASVHVRHEYRGERDL
jgi:hypothetical protein